MELKLVKEHFCFGGWVRYYSHFSKVNNCSMNFSVYIPPQAAKSEVPVLYYLSGLTCTEENFTIKAGAQRHASAAGLMLVVPDTSPRNTGIESDAPVGVGPGASFYVNATEEPWKKHYQMFDYVTEELPQVIKANFKVSEKQSIFGHSMGGHGALICALKKPEQYKSVSVFAPICSASRAPFGSKALRAYLGEKPETWKEWDAVELLATATKRLPILHDQGAEDEFLKEHMNLNLFKETCEKYKHPLTLRIHENYDHSYYFVSSFMEEHINYHAGFLK